MIRTDELWYRLGLVLRAEGVFERNSSPYKLHILSSLMFEEELRARTQHLDDADHFIEALFNIIRPEAFRKYRENKEAEEFEQKNDKAASAPVKYTEEGHRQVGPDEFSDEELADFERYVDHAFAEAVPEITPEMR